MAYQISRSLRFNSADSAYLSRTFGAATSRRIYTASIWMKLGKMGTTFYILDASVTAGGDQDGFRYNNDGTLQAFFNDAPDGNRTSTPVLRDPSKWYHVVWAVDTTNGTAANRCRIYVDGVELTLTGTTVTLNFDGNLNHNSGYATRLGAAASAVSPAECYFAEFYFVDGQQLTPSDFGETDAITGAWVPKAYAGTFGNNGCWLSFADNSSTTNVARDDAGGAAGAGAGSNDWTATNISVTAGAGNDSLVDTPTNYGTDTGVGGEVRGNYCTLNPIGNPAGPIWTLANGNLEFSHAASPGNAYKMIVVGTFGMTTGKWVFEYTVGATPNDQLGIGGPTLLVAGFPTNYAVYIDSTGSFGTGGGSAPGAGATYTTGDVIRVEFNADTGACQFFKNGTSQGTVTGLPANTYFPMRAAGSSSIGGASSFNFGQRPFVGTPTSGFKALCTGNLSDPTILKPASYFNAKLRTGTGATFSVTGELFQPALAWIKGRSGATDHAVYDAVRGVEKRLETNNTDDEVTGDTTGLTAFNSDGFTGGALAQINTNAATYVDWLWKEDAVSGFDIVTWTGNGANRTISHNLGAVPKLIIVKVRTSAGANVSWCVYHAENTAAPATDYLLLDSTAATADIDTLWQDTAPTSSVFSIGTNAGVNINGDTYVAYLWSEIPGFSKFGSYIGNGSADGPFVWCGFKPRWLLVKRTDTTGDWAIIDTARDTYNPVALRVYPNSNVAEDSTASLFDILSNGFKARATNLNASAGTYIFAAFAEMPFKFASAPYVSPNTDFDMNSRGGFILP